uniref:Uncharacterized protein n=1 Tax=Arundo donax TaxID=35708 RepID=A0A0A9HFU5_ARUDO
MKVVPVKGCKFPRITIFKHILMLDYAKTNFIASRKSTVFFFLRGKYCIFYLGESLL